MEFEDHFLGTKQLVKVSIIQFTFVETCYLYKLDVYLAIFFLNSIVLAAKLLI